MMRIIEGLQDIRWLSDSITEFVLHPTITLMLILLSVFVVLGNLLVVTAIWHETQLHSVTNYLIASLAAADCLVGAVVMPSSIVSEIIIGSWTFGPIWCDMWHSFDVLASTASIMNLCAISLDRYLAITNPISYPRKMTPKRVAFLIVGLWTCSSLISFPAIIWWRAVGPGPLEKLTAPQSSAAGVGAGVAAIGAKTGTGAGPTSAATLATPQAMASASRLSNKISPIDQLPQDIVTIGPEAELEQELYRCVFTKDTYYLLFSSIVSFYGPLCVMLYAYYRIYKAAVKQTRFLKHGSKQVSVGKRSKRQRRNRNISEHSTLNQEFTGDNAADSESNLDQFDSQHLVLRVHRGGGGGGGSGGVTGSSNTSANHSKSNIADSSNPAKGNEDTKQVASSIPSIVMMNSSDISNDSSLAPAAGATANHSKAQASQLALQPEDLSRNKRSPECKVSSGSAALVWHKDGDTSDVGESLEVGYSTTTTSARQQDHQNRGKSCGKGQIVYCDSDKLIQSIVDLTAIGYIDCTTQADLQVDNSDRRDNNDSQRAKGERPDESSKEKLNLEAPSESIQMPDEERASNAPRANKTVGKKLSKLAKERKAAKTLGIVVGVFILCWLPFFVVNIVVALCGDECIYKPNMMLTIVTWLGWLNSAMNPVIYACWSRDFRRAFRKVLCTWVEFVCPYDGGSLARKLKLKKKKSSKFLTHDAYLSRTCSSMKAAHNSTASFVPVAGSKLEGVANV